MCDSKGMKKTIDVQTGEVKAGVGEVILQSKAIGSCLGIAAYDAVKHIGALAHTMLPGSAPEGKTIKRTKYCADAIDAIISRMGRLGSRKEEIEVVLVGGGNVLKKEDDTICNENIESALKLLKKKALKVRTQAVGGIIRRSVSLDVERGIVYCSEGNGNERELWRSEKIPE